MGILIFKIRRELKDTINEIKKEEIKLEYLKRSYFLYKKICDFSIFGKRKIFYKSNIIKYF